MCFRFIHVVLQNNAPLPPSSSGVEPVGRRRPAGGAGEIHSAGGLQPLRLKNPEYFVVTIPGFLWYTRPECIGLGDLYDDVEFNYHPPPRSFPKHTLRSTGLPVSRPPRHRGR